MRKLIYLTILLQYIIISTRTFSNPDIKVRVAGMTSGAKTEIKAEIAGKFSLRLFGYTSADSLVQVLGVRTYAQGTSDRTGYFLFKDISVAREAAEICISSIDSERRSSFPVCISLPDTNKPTEIGPVLLAPTLSLSKATVWQNDQAGLSGATIPETEVVVSFFEITDEQRVAPALISKVYAAEVPMLTVKADKKGKFTTNIPTAKAENYRVFAKAIYKDSPTPKSQTLTFNIGAVTDYFIQFILPWLLFLLFFVIFIMLLIYYEKRYKVVRRFIQRRWGNFIEKKLKPFAVRYYLQFRRLLYNYRLWLSSLQK